MEGINYNQYRPIKLDIMIPCEYPDGNQFFEDIELMDGEQKEYYERLLNKHTRHIECLKSIFSQEDINKYIEHVCILVDTQYTLEKIKEVQSFYHKTIDDLFEELNLDKTPCINIEVYDAKSINPEEFTGQERYDEDSPLHRFNNGGVNSFIHAMTYIPATYSYGINGTGKPTKPTEIRNKKWIIESDCYLRSNNALKFIYNRLNGVGYKDTCPDTIIMFPQDVQEGTPKDDIKYSMNKRYLDTERNFQKLNGSKTLLSIQDTIDTTGIIFDYYHIPRIKYYCDQVLRDGAPLQRPHFLVEFDAYVQNLILEYSERPAVHTMQWVISLQHPQQASKTNGYLLSKPITIYNNHREWIKKTEAGPELQSRYFENNY